MIHLPVLLGTLAAAVLMACAAALLAVSEKAEATFPGQNSKIAHTATGGNNFGIYTSNPDGSGKIKVTNNNKVEDTPAYSPNGKRIANTSYDGHDTEIYTINVGGGGKSQVTDPAYNASYPSWGVVRRG